jgi:hypothetical protein
MTLGTTQLVSMALGVGIPLLNGLVTKYAARVTRVYLQLILTAAAGFLAEWAAAGDAYNWNEALLTWGLTLVTALSVEAKVWAPLGVSDALKRVGSGLGARRA